MTDPVNEVNRIGPVRMEIDSCVICGRTHVHGAPDDLRETFGGDVLPHRMAHCRAEDVDEDAPDGYFLKLSEDVELSSIPWCLLEGWG